MVGILLITHGEIGSKLLQTAQEILGQFKIPAAALNVSHKSNLDFVTSRAASLLKQLDNGSGVLIMTDLYGATPHNIAQKLDLDNKSLLSGLNLSMLLRALNYAHLPLEEMALKAQEGGHTGITCLVPEAQTC